MQTGTRQLWLRRFSGLWLTVWLALNLCAAIGHTHRHFEPPHAAPCFSEVISERDCAVCHWQATLGEAVCVAPVSFLFLPEPMPEHRLPLLARWQAPCQAPRSRGPPRLL